MRRITFILILVVRIANGQIILITGKDGEKFETELVNCSKHEITITEGSLPIEEVKSIGFTSYSENNSSRYEQLKSAGIYVYYDYRKGSNERMRPTTDRIIEGLPVDDGGICFSGIVRLDSVLKSEMYYRAKNYFATRFNSAKEVIQLDDKDNAVILGRGWQDVYISVPIGGPVAVQMWYKIRIQGKDGRYKYDVFDIVFTTYASQYSSSTSMSAEIVFDSRFYFNKRGNARTVPESYKINTLQAIEGITLGIKKAMKKGNTGKDDW